MNDREKALEDLKVIKRMMEAAEEALATNGIPLILFGVYWLVGALIWSLPGFKEGARSAPLLFLSLWIGFVISVTVFLLLYSRRIAREGRPSGVPLRYQKQVGELVVIMLLVVFSIAFLSRRLNLDPQAGRFFIFFVILLVQGLGSYFMGIAWSWEWRMVGLLMLAGMVAVFFTPGQEHLIFGLAFGIGTILTGSFLQRRWLRSRNRR